ncbi:MAG: hypothetical protein ACI9JN_001997 [Bacteroidia bacterium]|jgi:hypothetical protein
MKKVSLLIFALASTFGLMVKAQVGLPADATPGKCYAKCYIPDQWKTETERVMIKEASTKKVAIAAKFEARTERVLVKEASTILKVTPARYETRTERIMIKEASKKIKTYAARYENRTERLKVSDATTKWIKQKDAMCASENSDDCMVWCLVEVPAQYKTMRKSVLVEPAKTVDIAIPAEYKTVTKRVLVSAASTKEVIVPAVYSNVPKRVQVAPATFNTIAVPAQYKTITKRVLVKQGGMSEYREVVCAKYITNDLVRQVQRALIGKGYSVGPARDDNILGVDTRAGLLKYQRENGLPVGNLNKETLKHLGVPAKYWDK